MKKETKEPDYYLSKSVNWEDPRVQEAQRRLSAHFVDDQVNAIVEVAVMLQPINL